MRVPDRRCCTRNRTGDRRRRRDFLPINNFVSEGFSAHSRILANRSIGNFGLPHSVAAEDHPGGAIDPEGEIWSRKEKQDALSGLKFEVMDSNNSSVAICGCILLTTPGILTLIVEIIGFIFLFDSIVRTLGSSK